MKMFDDTGSRKVTCLICGSNNGKNFGSIIEPRGFCVDCLEALKKAL